MFKKKTTKLLLSSWSPADDGSFNSVAVLREQLHARSQKWRYFRYAFNVHVYMFHPNAMIGHLARVFLTAGAFFFVSSMN